MSGSKVEGSARPGGAERQLMDRVVMELREIERRSGIDRTLAIGQIILNDFFSGDPASWRDRRKNKNNSVRRIAERADCPFCKSALNEAVAVYVAVLKLPRVRTFGHIGASHVSSVLKLDEGRQLELLEAADREQLSVRELRKIVIGLRRASGERRGRPALDPFARALEALEKELRALAVSITQLDELGVREPGARQRLENVASELIKLGGQLEGMAMSGPRLAVARSLEVRDQTG